MKKFLFLVATDQISGGLVTVLKGLLWVLSQVYKYFIKCIVWMYKKGLLKAGRLSKPVISVGNITLGGAGKTPLVEKIARYLQEKGQKVVILTRGYMGGQNLSGNCQSDEADMLTKGLSDVPVLVGSNRLKNAQQYLQNHNADVFLLDDGFQHWQLHRDLDIVAIDTTNPWGNGHLIPRGILREPLRALSRADVFVLTKTDLGNTHINTIKNELEPFVFQKDIIETTHAPEVLFDLRSQNRLDLAFLKEKNICSFCSIGDPKSFEATLTKLGCHVQKNFAFMDHHLYDAQDIQSLNNFCQAQNIDIVVTTQKDAVKLPSLLGAFQNNLTILSLQIRLVMEHGEDKLFERINSLLHR